MKNALFFLFLLFVEGVFGDSVSVMEGDSVTLHTGLTEINKYDVIDWRVGGILIVRINTKANKTKFEDSFKDRYKLNDQTGDLIITNIRTVQAGEYEISDTIHFKKKFNVTVSAGERQSVSVMEGDSVTLYTDVTETQKYDVIRWKFGDSPIAEINRSSNNIPKYVPDGSFKNQLQLDGSTGSLTIKHINKSHSGGYDVDIIRSRHTIHKSFTVTVTVSGNKTQSVKPGESLTLYTGLTEIQSYDFILWKTRNTDLAEIYKAEGRFGTFDPDGSFRDRLKLDHQTGDLTIMNTKTTDSGLYELHITSSRHVIQKRFSVVATESGLSPAVLAVIVVFFLLVLGAAVAAGVIYIRRRISKIKSQTHNAKTVSVTAGYPATLHTDDVIDLQSTDVVMWLFGDKDNLIAKTTGGENPTCNLDERFLNRLQLNNRTGSLTIMKTTIEDSGRYKVKIDRSGKHTSQIFILSVINPTPNEVNEREETRTPFISQP